jgi:ectoine hydroxylase-related dioxygenase (phytanoyl-CoA dioxygenase family)
LEIELSIDVARYRSDGYLVIESVLNAAEIDGLRREVERLTAMIAAQPEAWGDTVDWDGNRPAASASTAIKRLEPLIDLSQAFADLARDPRVTGPVQALFGDSVELFEDKLNMKLPGGSGFQWHQDWSCCWRAHTDELITCFVSLDDATEQNGALQVIPGSHRSRECLPFRAGGEFDVDPAFVDESAAVTPRLRAGDMIVFDSYLLHYSDRNRSDLPRRTIIYTYSPGRLGRIYEYEALVAERAERVREAVGGV